MMKSLKHCYITTILAIALSLLSSIAHGFMVTTPRTMVVTVSKELSDKPTIMKSSSQANNEEEKEAADSSNDTNDKLSGSFFNPVPANKPQDPPTTNLNENPSSSSTSSSTPMSSDSFEESVSDLLRRRKSKPRASKPSTIGGVPTSKATGKYYLFIFINM